ncbi:MAG: CBS domain-containing protein [Gammaproteobacteria bacterium]|nr:CBS domain-containing protein [Gammaproteobacteria bacterium]
MNEIPPSNNLAAPVIVKLKPPARSWLVRLGQVMGVEPQDKEELLDILRAAAQREVLDGYTLAMLEGVFEVTDEQVRDIMIPRSQMTVVDHDANLHALLGIVTPSGHSRFPVIGDSKDEVEGILLAKDLLAYVGRESEFELRDVMRPAIFVPESKRLISLLKEFRSSRNHMAIVIDEYGGVSGLITIEDVIETIVGDIDDEHDTEEDLNIRKLAEHRYVVNALTELYEFNEFFKTEFDEDEWDTIGGWVTNLFGHLPKRGEYIDNAAMRFKVLSADSRRLHRLEVRLLSSANVNPE